jgi:hypothetical protein
VLTDGSVNEKYNVGDIALNPSPDILQSTAMTAHSLNMYESDIQSYSAIPSEASEQEILAGLV